MKKLILFPVSILLSACMANDLPKYSELNNLRILALVASSPEVDAGGSANITPVLSDIRETTALTYEAVGCIPVTSADTSCTGNSTAAAIQNGNLNTGDMTVARGFTGAGVVIPVTVPPAGVIFAQRSAQDQFNGVPYLVTYKISNSRGESVESFRRIIVSTRSSGSKNQNPVLNDVLANGVALTTTLPAAQQISVTPSFGAVTAESYQVQTDDGSIRTDSEELVTTWFATDGSFKYTRSVSEDENLYTAPDSLPSGRDTYLLAVTRDGRGGIAYSRKCFGNCP